MPGSFYQGKDYLVEQIAKLDIQTVIDVGAGHGTYSILFKNNGLQPERMDALEIWEPNIISHGLWNLYSNVYAADAREWENWFYDLVIFGDVLEHMTKEEALKVWTRVSKKAKYAVISIPIVLMEQGEEEGNPYEEHIKPDWTAEEVLATFPHIKQYRAFSHIGVFIADFSYTGKPHMDFEFDEVFLPKEGVFGGTEYMCNTFRDLLLPELPKFRDYRCLAIPGPSPTLPYLMDGTPTIVWMHVTPYQLPEGGYEMLGSEAFKRNVAWWIAVSEWHAKEIEFFLKVPRERIVVIENAIHPISTDLTRFESVTKPTIIHASHPQRGMEVLIPAAHMVDEDFELKIFNEFSPDLQPINPDITDIVLDERFTYYGRTPHATLLKYMAEAHIHAYPAYWAETSCIAQIEASASGLLCVLNNEGALPETARGYAEIVDFSRHPGTVPEANTDDTPDRVAFAKALTQAIQRIKTGDWNPEPQVKEINDYFSWDRARERWSDLHDRL